MKIKVTKNGKRKLIVSDDNEIRDVLDCIARNLNYIYLDELKQNSMGRTFECKCGEIIGLTDNYCSGCGRPIRKGEYA